MKSTFYPQPKPNTKKIASLLIELTMRAERAEQAQKAARLSDNKSKRKVVKNR